MAAPIGREADKMLQRFNELGRTDRRRLLDQALHMIEHQRDAKLPPHERKVKRLIDQIATCIDALEELPKGKRIQRRVLEGIVKDDRAKLMALGVTYFGEIVGA